MMTSKHLYRPIKKHLLKNTLPRVLLSSEESFGPANYIDRKKTTISGE